MKVFLSDEKNVLKYKKKLKEPRMWKYWKYAKKELLAEEIKTDENFENFAIYQTLLKEQAYRDVFVEFAKSNPKSAPIRILKALIDQSYVPENNELKNFISDTPRFATVSATHKNNIDTFSNLQYSWNNTNLPKNYCPENSYFNMNTNDRKKGITMLAGCWDKVPNKYTVINFMMASLRSMQKATISAEKYFLPLLGNACILAKSTLSKDEIGKMVNLIKANENKISSNRVQEFVEYLTGDVGSISIVPESFLKKIKDIRSVIFMSESNEDILNSLKL